MALDDQSEIVFRSVRRRCHVNQFLLVLSTELIRWTQAASGATGRANAGLCRIYRICFTFFLAQENCHNAH